MNNEVKTDVTESSGNSPNTQSLHGGIAYQNKDIASKYFAEEYKDTLFRAYGLRLPGIVRLEPTELPAIEVNKKELDNLFLLKDGSYAIVDYESEYSEENKVKYLGYVARVIGRLYNQTKKFPKIRLVIVYTADVKKGSTKSELDLTAVRLHLKEAFLSEMRAKEVLAECAAVIKEEKPLKPIQKLRLMLCPLSEKGKKSKRKTLRKVINLVREIKDENVQKQLLAGMIAFTDKIISQEDAEEIRRMLNMTKVGRIIYEEQMEGINNEAKRIAENLLRDGNTLESVVRNTGLDMATVESLAKKVAEEKVAVTV